MKRFCALILFITITACYAFGQKYSVTGQIIDDANNESIYKANVVLLKADSSFVSGISSDEDGYFRLSVASTGRYILKVTSLGYKNVFKNIAITKGTNVNIGQIKMISDAILLDGTTVTANTPKVTVKDDTLIFNAAAYRVPEGTTIEALVERLPGAQIDDDGKITINGKEVKKILIDGKEFMGGNVATAIKNLPSDVVDKIKSYEKQSDLSKLTGIDDGNEEEVLDINVKKSMKKGIMLNNDVGIGSRERYGARLMGARLGGDFRYSLLGNANNTNNLGFSGRRGRSGGGRDGLHSHKMMGVNINYEKPNILKVDASLRWNHSNGDVFSNSSAENYVSKRGAFSNNINQNYTRGNSWNFSTKVVWTIDSLTTLNFSPNLNFSSNDGRHINSSASYNDDPYKYVDNPLGQESLDSMAVNDLVVNARRNKSLSYGTSKSAGASFQLHRRLSKTGRNVAVGGDFSYSDNTNKNLSASNVRLYLLKNTAGNDSTYQTNRLSNTPATNWNYSLETTYTEPIMRATYLQLNYRFSYSYSKSDRSTYDFDDIDNGAFGNIMNQYRDWNSFLSYLQNPMESYYDSQLSRFSEYKNYTHNINVQLRIVRNKYNMNLGVMIKPQRSYFIQDFRGIYVDSVRNVTNIAPTMNFRYRFSKKSNLKATYRGVTNQPSISQMLDITDDSNPLNIVKGNPGLKPSFTNNMNVNYNTYFEKHQRALSANINFRNTDNNISNMVTYDESTGGRTTQPQNINGDWGVSAMFMFNTSIDTVGVWNVNTYSQVNYNHYVSYLALNSTSSSEKNVTRTTTYNERLSVGYKKGWVNIEADGSAYLTRTRNMLLGKNDMDTWRFSYGLNIDVKTPWNMSLSTDIHEHSRRGFNDMAMNTNELIWNLQLAQSFLKRKALTVRLQLYDILSEESNFSRSINATRRSDTEYNSINSYAMLHVSYRLNLMGRRLHKSK